MNALTKFLSTSCEILFWTLFASTAVVRCADVTFDIPSSIECRDVTPKDFTVTHPELKIVEAKLRISARIAEGNASDIVDFVYLIRVDPQMHIRDYTPNTTLESAVAADQIEVTAEKENSTATGVEASGAPTPLMLGGSHSQSSKKLESSRYKQVAAKDLVLASGTTEREHGVFYRIRPSRVSSLEGARDFSLVMVVPTSWRQALCTISCSSRSKKKSMFTSSLVSAATVQGQVGMYLASDTEAATVAENLCLSQQRLADLKAEAGAKGDVFLTIPGGGIIGSKEAARRRQLLEEAENAVRIAENQLQQWTK